jgi:hypothetical protein
MRQLLKDGESCFICQVELMLQSWI